MVATLPTNQKFLVSYTNRWDAAPGWAGYRKDIGRYGTNYLARAAIARFAVGANPPEAAVYLNCSADGEGKALSGTNHYVIHFNKGDLPPVKAFWSLTAYDKGGYFIKNSLNRYAIGDRDALKFNSDGSLDIYVQPESPGSDRESNWLPSYNGPFNLTIRLYWPGDSILSGAWHPPVPEKIR